MAAAGDTNRNSAVPAPSSVPGHALAPLVEHLRDGCFFVDYGMRVAFLNAVARRDIQSRGDDPQRYPGSLLWDVLKYAPDTRSRLRVLIDEAPLAIIVLDAETRVLHWNPEAQAMFQWTTEEVIGRLVPIVPPEERASLDANLKATRHGGSIRSKPAKRQRKDGVILDVHISAAPMRDGPGTIVGAIVMVSDVTAQRKLETQLRMAQKMEAVGLLAGGVAHEIGRAHV